MRSYALVLVLAAICLPLGLLRLFSAEKALAAKAPVLAITQIVEHPSLEGERQGVIEGLAEAGYRDGDTLKIIYQNAQGSSVLAAQIARQLVRQKPDVLLALSTPSAQAALAAVGERKLPLVFSAVSDPIAAGLIRERGKATSRITGISDALPSAPQLAMIRTFVPQLKQLGIVYNPGEANSVSMVEAMKQTAEAQGISLVLANAGNTNEVPQAAQSLIGRVSAIYVPNDNVAITALSGILRVAKQHRLPVFTADSESAARGAVATIGYSRRVLGKRVAQIIVQLLRGAKTEDIPVRYDHPLEITINREAAAAIGLSLPNPLPAHSLFVGETR